MAAVTITFEAVRTDKAAVEFTVTRSRGRSRDGRPTPPKFDPSLEPLKGILEKKYPLVIQVTHARQVQEVLDLVKEEKYQVPLVLVDGDGLLPYLDRLKEQEVGVLLKHPLVRTYRYRPYNSPDALARRGVAIAFPSGAGDGARDLPYSAMLAVQQGLSADAALAAFTTEAARMFKMDDRVGSLEPGKDGDLVIFSGHPFREGGSVARVLVNGEEVK